MTRRRNYRNRILGLVIIFAAISTFTFIKNINDRQTVDAYSLERFDPGYIISDYVMGDYNSMTEEEIQAFLTSKNNCSNTNYEYYQYLSQNPNYQWHWKDDHFVCLSEELFGDGEIIGEGEPAAHIIWQAAQDYQVNPKVLIVLIEKETSLITDKIPNNGDYRKATGYGCPDFAACSEKYYGFKNQVRNAASLFHTVLTGGWTNYPLGVNYIQYNPHSECGGSEVDIKSLATSALYRYTPYQPNEGALAAGYGTAYCGAYGNRNFYLYFGDWFGDPLFDGWENMSIPRYLTDSTTNEVKYYTVKRKIGDTVCLGVDVKETSCVDFANLKEVEWKWEDMITPKYYKLDKDAQTIRVTMQDAEIVTEENMYFVKKTSLPDGKLCLLPEVSSDWCAVFDTLKEASWPKQAMLYTRNLIAAEDTELFDPITREKYKTIKKGDKFYFIEKYTLADSKQCLIPRDEKGCIYEENLAEDWQEMEVPREMEFIKETYKIQSITGERNYDLKIDQGLIRRFVERMKKGDEWCLRTEYDLTHQNNSCILQSELKETWNYLEKHETFTVTEKTNKINVYSSEDGMAVDAGIVRNFTSKQYAFGKSEWCYRTEYDTELSADNCILESKLKQSTQ